MLELLAIVLIFAAIVAVLFLFARWLRSRGGSMTSVVLGATDGLYDAGKKGAAEAVVQQRADTKLEGQRSEGADDETEGEAEGS